MSRHRWGPAGRQDVLDYLGWNDGGGCPPPDPPLENYRKCRACGLVLTSSARSSVLLRDADCDLRVVRAVMES